jgi:hypothetical protein
MAKAKKVQLSQEEMYEQSKNTTFKELKEDFLRVGQAPNERKIFSVGEQVYTVNGGFISAYIIDILEEGIYEAEITYEANKPYSSEKHILVRKRILGWYDIFKLEKEDCNIQLGEDLRLTFMQQQVSSLISSYVISFGVNFNPSYQRDLVWDLSDEQKLIESIFNRVDIGKFVFIHLGYNSEILYEILDGRQRLTALYRYYTDQFQYKGYYYSDLPWKLKYVFDDTPVAVACTNKVGLAKKDILNYFLKLNTSGKPMSKEHIDKIEAQYKMLKDGE